MIGFWEKLNFKISYDEDLVIATYEIENAQASSYSSSFFFLPNLPNGKR